MAGTLDLDGTASFEPFELINSAEDLATKPGKAYRLSLEDGNGKSLGEFMFDAAVPPSHPTSDPSARTNGSRFSLYIPWNPLTARIVLRNGLGKTLAARTVSPQAPQVRIDPTVAGAAAPATGKQTLSWTGSDTDGDALSYSVWYSRDAGKTWLPIDHSLSGTSLEIDFDRLPGGAQALSRVLASDGVNTSEARSAAPLRVPGKAPQVFFAPPPTNRALPAGQEVLLQASAFDWEDGALTDDKAFTWSSDRDGSLGVGPWISYPLSDGVHTITVSVRDSDGNVTSAAQRVVVGRFPIYLPAIGGGA